MPIVLPVTSFRQNTQIQSAFDSNTPKYEYPITYEHHEANSIIGDVGASIIIGGTAALVSKAKVFNMSNKMVIGIGASVAGLSILMNLFTGLHGRYKEKYLNNKHRFENLHNKGGTFII